MSSNTGKHILITDDEASIRSALREILEFEGYTADEAENGKTALEKLSENNYGVMFLDIKMKGMDGFEVLEEINQRGLNVPVIMLTGHGTIETAIQATKLGAFDFLQKPPDLNRLLITVRNALQQGKLKEQNKAMRRSLVNVSEIVGESSSIKQIKATIQKVAPTDARVLITGENGTGKELVARWLHEYSRRNDDPFIEVNCAAIPAELLESELFGHEQGAFTGASRRRIGKFEQADKGTLFLDEIGDMSSTAQAKVLRALQENKITRVGGAENITVDVRILAATNKDLATEIKENNFREDLYHRINVIPIHVPPLRDRREDIPLLAEHFMAQMAGRDIIFEGKSFSDEALDLLKSLDWSGNVRELHNVVERLGILSNEPEIDAQTVKMLVSIPGKSSADGSFEDIIEEFSTFQEFKEAAEDKFIRYQLAKNEWNISQTADQIGIQRSHLYNKIKKYDIKR